PRDASWPTSAFGSARPCTITFSKIAYQGSAVVPGDNYRGHRARSIRRSGGAGDDIRSRIRDRRPRTLHKPPLVDANRLRTAAHFEPGACETFPGQDVSLRPGFEEDGRPLPSGSQGALLTPEQDIQDRGVGRMPISPTPVALLQPHHGHGGAPPLRRSARAVATRQQDHRGG
ncbi:unnamed protein product, partial [Ectocarpus sp. 12 AP-2014]